jgi:hypothetical protein
VFGTKRYTLRHVFPGLYLRVLLRCRVFGKRNVNAAAWAGVGVGVGGGGGLENFGSGVGAGMGALLSVTGGGR